MSENEYKSFVIDKTPPKISVPCAICKDGIEFRGLPVFPICENCRKILGELVASHKSNWGK